MARSLTQLLKDVGGRAVSEDRSRACARHIRLVLEDAKRETAQPADVEAVEADGAAALEALGADSSQLADDRPGGANTADILPVVCREAWSAPSDLLPEEPSMPTRAHRVLRIVPRR